MTERDLIQHLSTLQRIADQLRAVGNQTPYKGVVPIDPKGATDNADLLEEVMDRFTELIPETPMTLPTPPPRKSRRL